MTATLIALAVLAACVAAGVYLNTRARMQRDLVAERKAVEVKTTEAQKEVAHEESKIRNAPLDNKIDFARALRERGRLRKPPE